MNCWLCTAGASEQTRMERGRMEEFRMGEPQGDGKTISWMRSEAKKTGLNCTAMMAPKAVVLLQASGGSEHGGLKFGAQHRCALLIPQNRLHRLRLRKVRPKSHISRWRRSEE